MKFIRTILVFTYMFGLLYIRRSAITVLYVLATPLALTFLLLVISHGNFGTSIISGGLIMTLLNTGLALGSAATSNRIDFKYQEVLVASPVTQFEYLGGFALAELVYSSPGLAIYYILLLWNQTVIYTLEVVFISIIIWISLSSLGFFLSTVFSNLRNSWEVLSLIGVGLSVVPPVFYPIGSLPTPIQWVMLFFPTTHYSILLTSTMTNPWALGGPSAYLSWAYIIGFLAFALGLGAYKARWREV